MSINDAVRGLNTLFKLNQIPVTASQKGSTIEIVGDLVTGTSHAMGDAVGIGMAISNIVDKIDGFTALVFVG